MLIFKSFVVLKLLMENKDLQEKNKRGLKLAITGKGGVGKTTLASLLCYLYRQKGKRVIAVDGDPDANLAAALGIDDEQTSKIRPIAEMADLIEERTGARPGSQGGMFKLNPSVDDVPGEYGYQHNGITLLIMGKSKEAASGCYCPESVFLRQLLRHLIVESNEVVIVDMEAGIEHLTRGTADAVDAFIVVVEPGRRSIQTAETVWKLASGLGVKNVFIVANKIRGDADIEFIRDSIGTMDLIGSIGFAPEIMEADMRGVPPHTASSRAEMEAAAILRSIEKLV